MALNHSCSSSSINIHLICQCRPFSMTNGLHVVCSCRGGVYTTTQPATVVSSQDRRLITVRLCPDTRISDTGSEYGGDMPAVQLSVRCWTLATRASENNKHFFCETFEIPKENWQKCDLNIDWHGWLINNFNEIPLKIPEKLHQSNFV